MSTKQDYMGNKVIANTFKRLGNNEINRSLWTKLTLILGESAQLRTGEHAQHKQPENRGNAQHTNYCPRRLEEFKWAVNTIS
jgi:hypothetical protein